MKNKDMPAMPATVKIDRNPPPGSGYPTSKDVACSGLTKREMFAMHAMQGLSSLDVGTVQAYLEASGSNDIGAMLTKMSVEFADALLAELDK